MLSTRLTPEEDWPAIVTFLSCGRSVSGPTPGFGDNRPVFGGLPDPGSAQTGVSVPSAHSVLIAKIKFLVLKAVHAHSHSVRTLSNPRSKNCRSPITCLRTPLGVSAKWARLAYAFFPDSVFNLAATSRRTASC